MNGNYLMTLCIEVSAFSETSDAVTLRNDEPAKADGFAVYIRNPTAFHVEDFKPHTVGDDGYVSMREAHGYAFRYAGKLAEHLGCHVETTLSCGPTFWASRFIVEPQNDLNADLAPESEGTRFERCEPGEATQWAVYRLGATREGAPIEGTAELVEDYPTQTAATLAVDALERGEPAPAPVWPKAPRDPWEGTDAGIVALLHAYGFEPELAGGGCVRAVRYYGTAGHVIVTGADGGDMPAPDSWAVGIYPPTATEDAGGDALHLFYSEPDGPTLAEAIAGATAMAKALRAPVPAAPPAGTFPVDMFGIMAGYGPNSEGAMLPTLFDTYDDAEREAESRRNAPGRWACVVQVKSNGVAL